MSPGWLFSVSLLLHLVVLCAVFDIYFRSPVVSVERSFRPELEAPARRVVLFVADGLRADAIFTPNADGTPLAPYLRLVMERGGVWGVSHTHVPTESRPGHVALIGGLYEDPSAIARGWRENPVQFDTVFNQSRRTWAWGSPDILPMFARGAVPGRVVTDSYPAELEDFSARELSRLDTWVFERVDEFFQAARHNRSLQMELRQDGLVLFLHLLGCDTNGHRHNPRSPEYRENIRVVDRGVERVVELLDQYWRHDERTAFIFTADHGMTDWGSHGAGMAQETETPIVAWGAGLRGPIPVSTPTKPYSPPDWRLDHLQRSDIQQADAAPLMTTLLGVAVPKNSVGQLPDDFLDLSPRDKVQASVAVARQMFEQFSALQAGFADLRLAGLFHRAFPRISSTKMQVKLQDIAKFLDIGLYEKALRTAQTLWRDSYDGAEYYHQYYRLPLFISTSISYMVFILLTLTIVIRHFSILVQPTQAQSTPAAVWVSFAVAASVVVTLTLCQNVPYHFVIYFVTPIILMAAWAREWTSLVINPAALSVPVVVPLVLLVGTELLIWTFFDRRWLSVTILLVMSLQTQFHWTSDKRQFWLVPWILGNIALCGFTFQPSVVKQHDPWLVLGASLSSAAVCGFFARTYLGSTKAAFSMILLIVSGICSWLSLFDNYKLVAQVLSWSVFLGWIPMTLFTPSRAFERLLKVTMGLMSSYVLLSLTYEGLFMLCLVITMGAYMLMEFQDHAFHRQLSKFTLGTTQARKSIGVRDVFRSFLFLHFSIVSFFGTGNIASLNTFDPKSITTLVSVFSPFLMGALLLCKVLIPFLIVACFMRMMLSITRLNGQAMFLLVLLFSDWMSLHFFFLVTDQGSWLEIGTSLSHFIIAEGLVIFLQMFLVLAKGLLEFRSGGQKEPHDTHESDVEMLWPKSI